MRSLQHRAKAFEARYAHEQGLHFQAQSRRNKLIGLWAGETLGLAEPHDYASKLAEWAVDHQSTDDLLMKLQQDFDKAGVELDLGQLSTRMHNLLVEILTELRVG
jgi:hypothetical protein